MAAFSGFHLPESVGFAILGATLGAVVFELAGGEFAAHVELGAAAGAVSLICLAQVPLRRLTAMLGKGQAAPAPREQTMAQR